MSWGGTTQERDDQALADNQDSTNKIETDEQDTKMSDTNEETTVSETKKPATKRRTKSAAELLADARRRVEELEARVAGQRDQNRLDFVERLYDHFGAKAIKGDLDESERLEALRVRLDVEFE